MSGNNDSYSVQVCGKYTFATLDGVAIDPGGSLILDLWRRNVACPVEQPGRWVCSCFASTHVGNFAAWVCLIKTALSLGVDHIFNFRSPVSYVNFGRSTLLVFGGCYEHVTLLWKRILPSTSGYIDFHAIWHFLGI